jgi:hypothetical protein
MKHSLPAGMVALALLLGGCALTPEQADHRIDRLVAAAVAEWQLWGGQRVLERDDGSLCALFDATEAGVRRERATQPVLPPQADSRVPSPSPAMPPGANGSSDSSGGQVCLPVQDGCGRELSSRHCPLVNRYWPGVSDYRHPCTQTDLCVAQRPAGIAPVYTEPWSAAFISFVYRQAGFGWFRFSASDTHADYVAAARDGLMPDFALLATPLRPQRGDLLCLARGPSRGISPDQIDVIAPAASGPGFTRMHCDLVVGLDPARRVAMLIGGNVAQAVSLREVALDEQGFLHWEAPPRPGWLLALRLRAARPDLLTWRTATPGARTP